MSEKVLHDDPAFARRVEEFLDIPDFRSNAQQSFDILKGFCSAWNSKASVKHKVRFRVYDTIPTMSMVMIDPDTNIGEVELEFFLYHSGEFRPRFAVAKTHNGESLFDLVVERFNKLWDCSRIIE